MRSRKLLTTLSLTAVMLAVMAVPAMAYTIDGDMDDWGVNPGSDWNSNTAKLQKVENWDDPGAHNPGDERCDIEAMYIDEDENGPWVYFAIVTSTPEDGFSHPYAPGQTLIPGDLALDLNNDADFNMPGNEYGYEYGVKLTSYDYTDVGKGTPVQGHIGSVFKDPHWVKITTDFAQHNAPFSNMVQGPINPVWTANTDPNDPDIAYVQDDWSDGGYVNYVIEMRIPKSALGISDKGVLDLLATQSCTNDIIVTSFDYTPIPEFTTIAIPVGMILGLFYFFRRKRQSREEEAK